LKKDKNFYENFLVNLINIAFEKKTEEEITKEVIHDDDESNQENNEDETENVEKKDKKSRITQEKKIYTKIDNITLLEFLNIFLKPNSFYFDDNDYKTLFMSFFNNSKQVESIENVNKFDIKTIEKVKQMLLNKAKLLPINGDGEEGQKSQAGKSRGDGEDEEENGDEINLVQNDEEEDKSKDMSFTDEEEENENMEEKKEAYVSKRASRRPEKNGKAKKKPANDKSKEKDKNNDKEKVNKKKKIVEKVEEENEDDVMEREDSKSEAKKKNSSTAVKKEKSGKRDFVSYFINFF